MIECQGLSRRFHGRVAVEGLDLRVEPGTCCALLGRNGAGKSTTLAMLTGMLKPSAGWARVAGLEVSQECPELQRRLGVLPERLGLFDHLTVEEHLRLQGQVHGLPTKEWQARMETLLDLLDLGRGRHTFADRCSHGMRKKTALAMALLHGPEVLVLDEPFEGLDPVASLALTQVLRDFGARGGTVLFSSHILPTVASLADRCVLLHQGRVVMALEGHEVGASLERAFHELEEAPVPPELTWLGPSRS